MITYLLKSIVCSGLLLGMYFLFLEKEKMHRFNRFYLLSAFIVSWLIPLITFKISIPKITEHIQIAALPVVTNTFTQAQSSEVFIKTGIHPVPVNYFPGILWSVYGIITLILLVRFVMNMYQIRKQIISRKIEKLNNYSLVIIPDNEVSFSFFNYIFPAQSDYVKDEMNSAIFLHETVHAKEKHSIDILFIELCKVFLWFNPFVFLYKRAIQLNHEFLADDVVVAHNRDVFNYQSLLLSKITQLPISQLVSSSNYSITKKRFIMMTKKTSRIRMMWLKLSIIPIVGVAIFGFSKKVEAKNTIYKTSLQAETEQSNLSTFYSGDSDIVSSYQSLYNSLIQKRKDDKGRETVKYNGSRGNFLKLQKMYNSMNASQKSKVDSLDVFIKISLSPRTFPKQQKPTQAQIDKWAVHPELWGIWYNDKRIKNADIKNLNVAHYDAYGLTERAQKNDGFKVQVFVIDQQHYDEMIRHWVKYQDPIKGDYTIISESKTRIIRENVNTK